MSADPSYFERHIARLLIVLYHAGRPARQLEGETRMIDSVWELQRFDFWVREPGHFALALLRLDPKDKDAERKLILAQLLTDRALDTHRVAASGYNYLSDFDFSLSYLTSRALVSDRPSFVRSKNFGHQIILENAGIEVVRQILTDCPSFGWYRQQAERVNLFWSLLSGVDLSQMAYLKPDLTPAVAATVPLTSFVQARYQAIYGDLNV
jgi:hypothetical protein